MADTYKYSYTVNEKLLSSLSVYNVGHQRCTPGYQWGPGVRDHYLIHHVINGKGTYEIEGKIWRLKKGDTFLVYPEMEVSYRADDEKPWEYAWVGFAGNDAGSLLANTDFTVKSPVLAQAEISHDIRQGIMKVYEYKGNGFCDAVSMTGALYALMSVLMRHSENVTIQRNPQVEYVDRAVQYIAERYSYPISVEDVADYTGVSRSHLFRLFRQEMQISPKDYLTDYRISQARRLLRETGLSVAAIAHSVGFEDNLYFSKAFKRVEGRTPTEYRGKIKKDGS